MCGICGIVQHSDDQRPLVRRMCDSLAHRGPDHAEVYQSGNVTLGHRRLSIIDLQTGNQPIFNADKTLGIVYNGEIYNYRELYKELVKRGCRFSTHSDTEVVLKLYEIDGVDSFVRLNGIFSFAILDQRDGEKLVLARDHFGIKPLHYYCKNGLFAFASEYKALLLHPDVPRELNVQALHHQINLRYNQLQETLIKDIYRLPPAHFMIVRDANIERIERYFSLSPRINHSKSEQDWLHEIPQVIQRAVKRQLVSDVPIGVYLSGGMDSSTLVAMMRESGADPVSTFTLGFNEPTDEIDDAQYTVDRYATDHHVLRMDLNPMRNMPHVIRHAEEPKINLIQGYMMSQFVSQHVKVALGGLGGDELFAGYDIHKFFYPVNRLLKAVPREFEAGIGSKLASLLYSLQSRLPMQWDEYRRGLQMALSVGNLAKFYLILRNVWDFDRAHYDKIYHSGFLDHNLQPVMDEFEPLFDSVSGHSPLERVFIAEMRSKMVNDYLLVEDRMSMANSLEERVPFLDLDLVEFALSIPGDMKMRGTETKYLMRKALASYLPGHIVRKKKWGFTFNPYLQFQKKDLKTTAERILTKKRIERDGIFNYEYIKAILDAKPHPRLRWHYNYIWVLTGFYIWKQLFLESGSGDQDMQLEAFYSA